jgi:phage terminase large subunit-like protein
MSRDQAAKLFALAEKMVLMNPDLSLAVGIRATKKQLYCAERGTEYTALSADASTNFGASPIFLVHDELGQVKGPTSALYAAMETGCGAHENPLSVIISTQAPTDGDLLSILIDDALARNDPHTVISLYTAPIDDDPFLVKTIKKANPAFGDFLNANEIKRLAKKARRLPSFESEYRNLHLNQRVEASSPFISRNLWKKNGLPPTDFEDRPVYGGLDLSEVRDLTAKVLIAQKDSAWHCRPTFWLPGQGLSEKSDHDRVPYSSWAKQGYLETTPGPSIEYEYIAHELRKDFDTMNIKIIAFDRWNWKHLEPWLKRAGTR